MRFRVYIKGVYLSYASEVRISPHQWNFETSQYGFENPYTDTQYKMINERLDTIHNIIEHICTKYHVNELTSEFLTEEVNRELHRQDTADDLLNKPFSECFEDYIASHRMHYNRRKYFKVVLKSFMAYESYLRCLNPRQKPITYNTISYKLLDEFVDFIVEEERLSELFPMIHNGEKRNFRDRCTDTGYNYLRYIRCVINEIRKQSGTTHYPMQNYRIKPAKVSKPIALTLQEIRQLYEYTPETKALQLVKDNFLLQICLAVRVDDFVNLKFNSILLDNQEGINYLCFTPRKTADSSGKLVEVPLNNLARELIIRYKDSSEHLVPHFSEQHYTRQLKVLFEKAGLTRTVVQYDRSKGTDVHLPLYRYATSHIARKTAITRLYNLGCPTDLINDICGHVGDKVKSRYTEFDLSTKLDYLNQICPWYQVDQPLIDVTNNVIIQQEQTKRCRIIPLGAASMAL